MDPQNGRKETTEEKTKSRDGGNMSGRNGIPRSKDTSPNSQPTNQNDAASRSRKRGGPRTTLGKERSRRNAVTHGIYAKVVLLKEENPTMLWALMKGFREAFQPVGVVEEALVEELATLKWRIRRLLTDVLEVPDHAARLGAVEVCVQLLEAFPSADPKVAEPVGMITIVAPPRPEIAASSGPPPQSPSSVTRGPLSLTMPGPPIGSPRPRDRS
jgi:hypothetical protein